MSLVIIEMLVKTTVKYQYICISIGKIFTNQWYQMRATVLNNWNSHILLVGMQHGIGTLEASMPVSYKVKHTLTIQTSNPTFWVFSQDKWKHVFTQKICMEMFIAALFIVPHTLKQSRCPSPGECTNNCNISMQYITEQ